MTQARNHAPEAKAARAPGQGAINELNELGVQEGQA